MDRDRSLAMGQTAVRYLVFLESLVGVLDSALTGDPIVLLGVSNAHGGNNSDIRKDVTGRNGVPQLNPRGVLFLDVSSILNTVFEDTRTEVVSADLGTHVLDTQVKREWLSCHPITTWWRGGPAGGGRTGTVDPNGL